MNKSVCIIDYGLGNIRSVFNLIQTSDVEVYVSNKKEDFDRATHIVLPGVGAFGAAMEKLESLGVIPEIERNVLRDKKPFLGICVGMQILAEKGFEHGEYKGLAWIKGEVKKMNVGDLLLPHVGWNNVHVGKGTKLFKDLLNEPDFYFVHSYSFFPNDEDVTTTVFSYGNNFIASVEKGNIYGVQFHPEKSQRAGEILFKNFLEL